MLAGIKTEALLLLVGPGGGGNDGGPRWRRLTDGELRHGPDLWFGGRDGDPLLVLLLPTVQQV